MRPLHSMKPWHAATLGMALVIGIGCSESKPGGPGVMTTPPQSSSTTALKPVLGPDENTFNLSVPVLSTHLKQGEAVTGAISLSRGKNFDEDVALTFSGLPQGVTMEPQTAMIRHGDADAKVTFHATDDAALGDFTIKVMGHPAQGADAQSDFKLTVDKK